MGAGLTAATLAVAWAMLFLRPLPTVDGHYRLLGLHGRAEIVRDVLGIPRIYARDLHDLFFLQGYVTAQDRLAQMEEMRVAARAAFSAEAERGVGLAAAGLREALDAYAEGVNKLIAQHAPARALPGELVLAGRHPQRWTPADTLAIVAAYVERLVPTSVCVSIGPAATLKGRPLFAADLYTYAPAPGWYEVGLSTDAARAIGISLPGVPGIAAGHNGWIAWATILARGARPDPAPTLAAMLDAPFVRDPARLSASGAALRVTCVSDGTRVVGVDGPRQPALERDVAAARGLDIETLRMVLGGPAAPIGARILVDLADVDTSRSAVSHGASAHLASPHWRDQAALWEIGQLHRLPFTRQSVGRTDGVLVLRAR